MMTDNPRLAIVWHALEIATETPAAVLEACRRIVAAERIGWRRFGKREDLAFVLDYLTTAKLETV